MVVQNNEFKICFFFKLYFSLLLAALHYKANSDRQQATTKSGKKRYKVSKPKFKTEKASVKAIKEDATYCK